MSWAKYMALIFAALTIEVVTAPAWLPPLRSSWLWLETPGPAECFAIERFVSGPYRRLPASCADWRHCGAEEENSANGYSCRAEDK